MKNWEKISLMMALFAGISFGASAETMKSKGKKVPYTIAQRYFVKNTVADGTFFYPKITSQEAFDELFGMAAVMGKDGTPTSIDFSKQYVIAVIDGITNATVQLEAKSLVKTEGTITLTYNRTEVGKSASASFRHCLILIVDKKYDGNVIIENTNKQQGIPFQIAKRYFVNNTVENGEFFYPAITSGEEFEKLFGMATVMGKDGTPTPVDFSRQFVIAVVNPETHSLVDFEVKSLLKKDGVITLNYRKTGTDSNKGATFRSCLILIVDKTYQGKVVFQLEK